MSRYSGWDAMDDDELDLVLVNSRSAAHSAEAMGAEELADGFRADAVAAEREIRRRGRDPGIVGVEPVGVGSRPVPVRRPRRVPSSALVADAADLAALPVGVVIVDLTTSPPRAWQRGDGDVWHDAGGHRAMPSADLWAADEVRRFAVVYCPGDEAGLG